MGIKKKFIFGMLKGLKNHRNLRGYAKKLIIAATVLGILFLIGSILLIGFVINQLGRIAAGPSDIELVALEQLVQDKAIVLNESQKEQIAPLLQSLTSEGLSSTEAQRLKNDILTILDNKQMEMLTSEVKNLEAGTRGLVESGHSTLVDWVSGITGISAENVNSLTKGARDWLQSQGVGNEGPENLLNQIETSQ